MRILIKSEYIEHEVNIMDIFGRPSARCLPDHEIHRMSFYSLMDDSALRANMINVYKLFTLGQHLIP